nr:uncharacterized protein LOC128693244 [Cherax quadricarinatus]
MCETLLTMGMVQYEAGGGRKVLVEGEKEDLLSKLRQLPHTLIECQSRMDRLDRYIQHVHTLPGNITFFQTRLGNQEDLKDIFDRQTHPGKVLGHQEVLRDVLGPQMHSENAHRYQMDFSGDACGTYVHHGKALGSQKRSEDALGRHIDLGKALEPQTDFEDKAVGHQIHPEDAFAPLTYPGDAHGTQAHPGDFVELQTHLKYPQQLDTSSDEVIMHSKSLHSNTDCVHAVQLPQTVTESPYSNCKYWPC